MNRSVVLLVSIAVLGVLVAFLSLGATRKYVPTPCGLRRNLDYETTRARFRTPNKGRIVRTESGGLEGSSEVNVYADGNVELKIERRRGGRRGKWHCNAKVIDALKRQIDGEEFRVGGPWKGCSRCTDVYGKLILGQGATRASFDLAGACGDGDPSYIHTAWSEVAHIEKAVEAWTRDSKLCTPLEVDLSYENRQEIQRNQSGDAEREQRQRASLMASLDRVDNEARRFPWRVEWNVGRGIRVEWWAQGRSREVRDLQIDDRGMAFLVHQRDGIEIQESFVVPESVVSETKDFLSSIATEPGFDPSCASSATGVMFTVHPHLSGFPTNAICGARAVQTGGRLLNIVERGYLPKHLNTATQVEREYAALSALRRQTKAAVLSCRKQSGMPSDEGFTVTIGWWAAGESPLPGKEKGYLQGWLPRGNQPEALSQCIDNVFVGRRLSGNHSLRAVVEY